MEKKGKEVYRSYKGELDLINQFCYVIYEGKKYYTVEFHSIISAKPDSVKIPKTLLSENDFTNLSKISNINAAISEGHYDDGYILYRGKWYSCKQIHDIQRRNNDYTWKRYV